jgi:pre-mRNA-splicing factor 38A
MIERNLRLKVYDSTYWKAQCFGLTAESLLDEAVKLRSVGGSVGPARKPSRFVSLALKLLQIQPDRDVVLEYITAEDHKYVRLLGAFYWRLTARPADVFAYLEPLLNDSRRVRVRAHSGYPMRRPPSGSNPSPLYRAPRLGCVAAEPRENVSIPLAPARARKARPLPSRCVLQTEKTDTHKPKTPNRAAAAQSSTYDKRGAAAAAAAAAAAMAAACGPSKRSAAAAHSFRPSPCRPPCSWWMATPPLTAPPPTRWRPRAGWRARGLDIKLSP